MASGVAHNAFAGIQPAMARPAKGSRAANAPIPTARSVKRGTLVIENQRRPFIQSPPDQTQKNTPEQKAAQRSPRASQPLRPKVTSPSSALPPSRYQIRASFQLRDRTRDHSPV